MNGLLSLYEIDGKDPIQKLKISSNEKDNKEIIQQIKAFYPPELIEVCKLDIGDLVKGNCCIELKTASDFLSSLKPEPGSTVSRILRQAYNMQQYPIAEIIVSATLPEIIYESRKFDSKEHWNLDSLTGYIASIRTRFNIPVILWGKLKLDYYIYSLLEKSNDDKVREINPLRASATTKHQQLAVIQSIKDIGPATANNLLSHFKTIKNIINASPSQLMEVDGIGKKTSNKIYELIHQEYQK